MKLQLILKEGWLEQFCGHLLELTIEMFKLKIKPDEGSYFL